MSPPPPVPDPTLRRRASIARLTRLGRQLGYGALGLAVAVFAFGAAAGFPPWVVIVVVACIAAGSVVLAPAIVFGYAVKAAEREDRERAASRRSP